MTLAATKRADAVDSPTAGLLFRDAASDTRAKEAVVTVELSPVLFVAARLGVDRRIGVVVERVVVRALLVISDVRVKVVVVSVDVSCSKVVTASVIGALPTVI